VSDALRESYRYCATVSRREARNFYYGFLLLPPERRRSMCSLYAYMRKTDDLADEPGDARQKHTALDAWRAALDRALRGDGGDWPGFPALADAVRRHAIPARYLHEVIDGVLMDLEPRGYATFDELAVYCDRVASAVGRSCLHVWGFRSEGGRAEELANDYGLALQLTNILRDVREDARNGRVYLPGEDLARFGVERADLLSDRLTDRLRLLFEFQARRAYGLYDRAAPLAGLVAPAGRPVLRAIVGIYRALLDEIVRRDYDVLSARVALPPWRKAAVALRSLAGGPSPAMLARPEPRRC
jgi:phytoene synthase